MGAWALLLPLLWAAAPTQACSVNQTLFEIEENTKHSEPLVDIIVPQGQRVTLGPSSTPFAFRIQGNQLFLNITPDYEEDTTLVAQLLCKRGDELVTQQNVFVIVLDVNDNPPVFPFKVKVKGVPEDTKVNTTIIAEAELEAQDADKEDTLFYTLQEVTPGTGGLCSLVGVNRPALRLNQSLDFNRHRNVTFQLLVRDTQEEGAVPSHTATATVVLEVQPADLRPPWFLPCVYEDAQICVQAQYRGAIPTGHRLPGPLILRPGPIYAVDGDRGINQRIIYSILRRNAKDSTFAIDADSGNLTMTQSVGDPQTFILLVKGEQEDRARYSVTQVTVEARAASGRPPHFPQGLFRGTVELGSGVGVAVRDAASPSQPLRVCAQDPEFPDINSAISYRVTNSSSFQIDGEAVLTAAPLERAGLFYAEVEANNTATSDTATAVLEVEVTEPQPGPTGPPTTPEAGRTTRPTGSSTSGAPGPPGPSPSPSTTSAGGTVGPHPPTGDSTSGAPGPPGPSPSPSTTSAGGTTGPHPPTGTTLRPPTSSTPGGSSSEGISTSPSSTPPGGGSAGTSNPGGSPVEDQRFSVAEMAALGGVLGALLLLALIALAVLVRKHYGPRLPCCSGKAREPQPQGFDNKAFLPDHEEANWAPAPSPPPGQALAEVPPAPPSPVLRAPASPGPGPEAPAAARDEGGAAGVRSILTKERRPEGGYKAVWFGENIGAEADVVVLNAPTSDADHASDSGTEDSSGDEGEDAGPGPGADSTYM
ncbi:cadherin-related family member 5 [Pteronotus mesoamericanus]|uniref:cadherin-related family member 5 n=1 Tax=Pteronotus mesoamericanus TaxID=1884717 RepID=UPI0023EB240E|nr:cadherin-related family member 5 [Pteronotus parnellii mesoamericanus]